MTERSPAADRLDHDIVVVGGGLVGLSVAHGLCGRGLRIAVLDEGDVAHRASRGNFALVWVQSKGLQFPDYARWSLRSAGLWPALAAELKALTGIDVALEQRGGVTAFLDEESLAARVEEHRRLHNVAPDAAPVEVLSRRELARLIPVIGPDVVGGLYGPRDGHLNSLRLFRALHAGVAARAAYRPDHAVTAIRRTSAGFEIVAGGRVFRARRLVLAAGLANARLAPMVGLHAPVRPQRGQVMVTEKLAPLLPLPLVNLRQTDEGGVMIGDSMEEVGFDDGQDSRVLAAIAARAVRLVPALAAVRIVRSWGALRVMSPDGYPLYDRRDDAFLVTCHSGVTLAAAHARIVADAIAGDGWPADLGPFGAGRLHGVPQAA